MKTNEGVRPDHFYKEKPLLRKLQTKITKNQAEENHNQANNNIERL
jgi:hypothetical protein